MNRAEGVVRALKRHYGQNAFRGSPDDPFRVLVSCILSQRTRDENALKATKALFAVASTPQGILAINPDSLKRLIRSSGYYNQKAKHIIGASRAIIERCSGVTPRTRVDLMMLPGVGPKTADIVLSYGYGEPAIAVDTHIYRVVKRLGLVEMRAGPQDVKRELEDSISREDYSFADGAILSIGKEFCKPSKPRCGGCPLEKLCEKKFT
jgi:endonuclease-3